jgi:RNase P/RNase MRP subunit p30
LRKYVDIYTHPSSENQLLLNNLVELGYSYAGLSIIEKHSKIDIVHRIDFTPKNQNELSRLIRKYRWSVEVVTIMCGTRSISRQAGKDSRVDLLSFPITDTLKRNYLDRQQANLMKDSGCRYLVDLSLLLIDDSFLLRKHIEFLKRNIQNAIKKGVNVVASSGATNKWGLRDPPGLSSLLSLLDVNEAHGLDMISNIPKMMIDSNRSKLSKVNQ